MPQQGRDAQEDGVLRETDVVGAGLQQDLQLGQALRGQPRLEDRLAGGLDTELLSAEPLVLGRRDGGGRFAGGEPAPHHPGGHPGGKPDERPATADSQGAVRHAVDHLLPAFHPLQGGFPDGRVGMVGGGAHRLQKLVVDVLIHDVPPGGDTNLAGVAGAAPAPSGSIARCSTAELHAVATSVEDPIDRSRGVVTAVSNPRFGRG